MNSQKPPVNPTQRLFLALWPDDDVRQQLSHYAQGWTWPPGCAQYLPADWHVTLHFIGNVQTDRVADVVANVAVRFQPFEWVLDQPKLWPHGLAVLCASEVPTPLLALHDRLRDALCGLGLPVETRQYQPHVTLARRAGAVIPPSVPPSILWRASRYALAVSTGSTAERYLIIRQYG